MSSLERARVLSQAHELYSVATAQGEQLAQVTGRLRFLDELPAVGDWVTLTPTQPPLITAIEPRTSCFTRTAPGGGRQILAANIDVAFLVCGLDADFNPNRLDRYLVQARQSGARPVVILNKADLRPAPPLAVDVPVAAVSALQGDLAGLTAHVQPGETAALFGSSGVGKSTIVNRLLGAQRQATGDIPGRHVTTSRQLILLPAGWWLLDMPGLRELALDATSVAVNEAFAEISPQQCRYRDCRHEEEPGCAIRDHIDPARLASYRKLRREQAYAERKDDPVAARAEKERWKKIHKAMRKPG
jgi:ribosome biogenesis GTPase